VSEYLTTEEVALLLRISPDTLRWQRYVGRGPSSFKVGRRVLYAREDVEKFVADARLDSAAQSNSSRMSRPGGSGLNGRHG
jgi:excisionase family DNA binding protein